MTVSMEQVMRSINNYFESGWRDGGWNIAGNRLEPDGVFLTGMYVLIRGSCFHDGVWQLDDHLTLIGCEAETPDETFRGRMYKLHPPRGFLEVYEAIRAFAEKAGADGLKSESFGEYSMTRADGKNGSVLTWQEAFADALRPYRRMVSEVI